MNVPKYDWVKIAQQRADRCSWEEIAQNLGVKSSTLRSYAYRSKRLQKLISVQSEGLKSLEEATAEPSYSVERTFTEEEISRITTLDDLLAFFKVDTDAWEVRDYRVNSWEQHSVKKGLVTLYQVRANLIPRIERRVEVAREVIADMLKDAASHSPEYWTPPPPWPLPAGGEPVLFELAVFDPHIGMLAWGKEVGVPYDLEIALRDYGAAVTDLLTWASHYNVEKILFVAGNDFLHVDGPAFDARGGSRGGATSAGTMQDIDTRLAKMFTAGRRALVEAIDRARTIAPVDVQVVPGNHDEQQMYRMGEVLSAWYRNDERVKVLYGPGRRFYYKYGANLLGFTHGMEFNRKRDNLALIMATEVPAEWAETTHREWHVGHNHIAQELQYMQPVTALSEGRAIRVRSLPGLTSEDAWHYQEGYKHRRTATALVFRKNGGLAGLHEFNP